MQSFCLAILVIPHYIGSSLVMSVDNKIRIFSEIIRIYHLFHLYIEVVLGVLQAEAYLILKSMT